MTHSKKSYNYLINSVVRALDILEEIIERNGTVRIKDLSETFKLPKSTIHRFIATLEYKGYIEQIEDNHKYRLSLKLFELGGSVIHSLDLHSRSYPILEKLNLKVKETVHLVILDKGEAVFINKIVNNPSMLTYTYIGKRVHAHCIASGKVLLANLPLSELEIIISDKGLPEYTNNTLTCPNVLKEQLEEIRKNDVGYCFEEYLPGIVGVASPIRNHLGQVIAAVSISGFSISFDNNSLYYFTEEVKKVAKEISNELGANIVNQMPKR